jgi:hypothetical protein
MTNTIKTLRRKVPDAHRHQITERLFGINFPLALEPMVYAIAARLCVEYRGGHWDFFTLPDNGFYMVPSSPKTFDVSCENGFSGTLSADAFGIATSLYAYSHLSFSKQDDLSDLCADHFGKLRHHALGHPERGAIMAATD